MAVRIVEYDASKEAAVTAFNGRLKAGGATQGFSESHVPAWLPPRPDRTLFMQYFLAVEDDATVRGCYALKHQDFSISGRTRSIGLIALPISEGIVNRGYAAVGAQLIMHAIRQKPLIYGLGLGGESEAITHMVRAAGWRVAPVPFFFRVIRPFGFLRNIRSLRNSPLRRLLMDALAFSGGGWLGIKAIHLFSRFRLPDGRSLSVEIVDEFSAWADEVWTRCAPHYGYCAVRDAATLRILYPAGDSRFIRMKISEAGCPIGWAVLLATDFTHHKHFGGMRLGTIVDVLAIPKDADKVVFCAERLLRMQKVDLIVTNQSHATWQAALRQCGFLTGPSTFLLATSRKLTDLLNESNLTGDRLHLNRGDGDGPINL